MKLTAAIKARSRMAKVSVDWRVAMASGGMRMGFFGTGSAAHETVEQWAAR